MKKTRSVQLASLIFAAALSGTTSAVAGESVPVPTTATIVKGLLIDEYPGPPPPGSTDLDLPFYGTITPEHPACAVRRAYEIGRVEPDGEFVSIGRTTAPESGRWTFGLSGEISRPTPIAIRVLPRQTTYRGTPYLCEEALSPSVVEDSSDFSPCKVAQAAKRGYAPAIRMTRRIIREAEARRDEETSGIYRRQLERFQSYWPSIQRAVKRQCGA